MSEKVVTKFLDFNSCIPYGMQLLHNLLIICERPISIHASLMGCNSFPELRWRLILIFQFMHPLWDATGSSQFSGMPVVISIHASLMGCNRKIQYSYSHLYYILYILCYIIFLYILYTIISINSPSFIGANLPVLLCALKIRTCILFFACPKDVGILTNCFCM